MNESKKIRERIKTLFAWRGITYEEYARRVFKKTGKKISTNSLSHKLARETISYKEVLEIAYYLGYDVVFQPKPNWE
ncbi:MAG: LLM class flavin-dependent oxidoreductase [Muribaculaceae bacterium]|nr:LLM class flavin-dependent oxidoreductase [Muribaculaceae bacterium]